MTDHRFPFVADQVLVVGIVNVTPDSFSDGGNFTDPAAAVRHARRLADEGAGLIDIGGESTRPGAVPVSIEEELRRVVPVIEAVSGLGIAVSVDTRRARVAGAAVHAGARVVNDVSGLRDAEMVRVAAEAGVPVVIMHAPFADMERTHRHQAHDDVVFEVVEFLSAQARMALDAGIPDVAIDPGLGFGKTLAQNIELVARLGELTRLGHPVMIGASRKRMIGTLTGVDQPNQRDPGSVALHLAAISRGARMVRVHDVAAHIQAIAVWQAVGLERPQTGAAS